ncbi:MAG: hypothetical protein IT429_24850 [Gemmataceae bacterium]|nr:hypothetical protein [Gemmataceae bacterium]
MIDKRMLDRVESLIEKGEQVARTVKPLPPNYIGFDDPVQTDLSSEWRSQSAAFLNNLLGADHPYTTSFEAAFANSGGISATKQGLGVLRAVREDIRDGFLASFRELVHADVFDDFLAMAEYLVRDGGYKDAAAVIAGSTLEEHLRMLCQKHGVATTVVRPNGAAEPKNASAMNDELRQQGAYTQIDWRAVQGWLDLRNHAAHGDYGKYTKDQVVLMIDGVRNFLARNPA